MVGKLACKLVLDDSSEPLEGKQACSSVVLVLGSSVEQEQEQGSRLVLVLVHSKRVLALELEHSKRVLVQEPVHNKLALALDSKSALALGRSKSELDGKREHVLREREAGRLACIQVCKLELVHSTWVRNG